MKSIEFLKENMSRAAKGNEKYGKEGMKALAKAGREGASEKELDRIRDKHDKYDESIEEGWSDKYKDSINCSNPKGFSQKAHCAGKKKNEGIDSADVGEYDREGQMAQQDLLNAADAANELRSILDADDNLPEWVQAKITKALDYLDTTRDYMKAKEDQHMSPSGVKTNMDPKDDDYEINYGKTGLAGQFLEETYHGDEFYEAYGEMYYNEDEQLDEAEYRGRKVSLGKPMQGDVKKFKVYVKDPKTGNVKKVNFGDPNMRIKKSNPARRKSFRARHNCANPGPRTKARYWSCRKW